MKPVARILNKGRTALFTASGRRKLRRALALAIANSKCSGKAPFEHFFYLRPDGTKFVYLKRDSFSQHIYFERDFELREISWVAAWLADGGTFIDGGANIGVFSASIRQISPVAKIVAIECSPKIFRRLQFVLDALGLAGIETHLAALGNEDGQWVINAGPESDEALNYVEKCTVKSEDAVETVTLRHFLKRDLPKPVLVKLDIEGSELSALHGLDDWLSQKDKVAPAIILEVNRQALLERKASADLVYEWLQRYRYSIYFAGAWGQGPFFGTRLESFAGLPRAFNLIAIGSDSLSQQRWKQMINGSPSSKFPSPPEVLALTEQSCGNCG